MVQISISKEMTLADELASQGRKGYIIPGGGSDPIGATGYVACAQELQEQLFEQGLVIDRLVVASGSTGTHAGLLTGFSGLDAPGDQGHSGLAFQNCHLHADA